ncbi:unnamed protein product [Parnassius mnemosyne]|uniref:FLYWCH-type domain-containing protein n=1 Tax=Parnassius mnemosyne TaxID=213953 RepID=A0AAV1K7Q0_9NEOP
MATILPPAPDELLNTCKNGCGPRCGCRKSGLQCYSPFGQCNEQACLNAVSLQRDCEKVSAFDPEILVVSSAAYRMIPTRRGKYLLMLNRYTFSQMKQTNNFYCSKKDAGCKARVKLSTNGLIQQAFTGHTHPPPKYMVTSDGIYVKLHS